MAEYPEIATITHQLGERLVGKHITGIEVLQPKCLNIGQVEFITALKGAESNRPGQRGKWIQVQTSQGWLLLNVGMGGEILVVTRQTLPVKKRLLFDLDDGACLSVNFWWFGYAHYVPAGQLEQHAMTARLGTNALELSPEAFRTLVKGLHGGVKAFLLDQAKIAGIGNAYIHDILFLARLHPMHRMDNLSPTEVDTLFHAIEGGLRPSLERGGAFYEKDTYGNPGQFTFDFILVGYKEGKPCPDCGAVIEKIKTGSTTSFICPNCQK